MGKVSTTTAVKEYLKNLETKNAEKYNIIEDDDSYILTTKDLELAKNIIGSLMINVPLYLKGVNSKGEEVLKIIDRKEIEVMIKISKTENNKHVKL